MVVGVPLLNGRVAPRCTSADHLLVVTLRREHVVSHRAVPVEIKSPILLLDLLHSHGVGTLVCGGISNEAREAVQAEAIAVVDNVACSSAEVIAALEAGALCPDFGFGVSGRRGKGTGTRREGRQARGAAGDLPDCLACVDRICLQGQPCDIAAAGDAAEETSDEVRRTLSACADIALEIERQLCRLSELVYFCLEMGYSTIGVAFCVDLLEPAEILVRVLRRFFTVVPVCCAAGGVATEESGAQQSAAPCNPLRQARILNEVHTDVNVIVGLCIGADCIFAAASEAPVTTLFVKDRSLANNPIGAVYSEYHLRESTDLRGARGTGRGSGRLGGTGMPPPPPPRPKEAP